MHHVAIMKPAWKLIPKIMSGEKTIESRWYQTRRVPWNTIAAGDIVYFKNSGQPVTVQATVSKVLQFELPDVAAAQKVVKKYGQDIGLINRDPATWGKVPRYCILAFLENPKAIKPFSINKKGFGSAAAWITVKDIKKIISS